MAQFFKSCLREWRRESFRTSIPKNPISRRNTHHSKGTDFLKPLTSFFDVRLVSIGRKTHVCARGGNRYVVNVWYDNVVG